MHGADPKARRARGARGEQAAAGDAPMQLEPTEFFTKHGRSVATLRDGLVFALYAIVFAVVVITSWVKMQTGAFPFNMAPIARATYGPNGWPVAAFVLVTLGFLAVVLLRLVVITVVENYIGDAVERAVQCRVKCHEVELSHDPLAA
jgi:hypothetical protein